MAILSAILSLIARQLSNILQAIFGWSITALFGKLPSQKQTALSVALVLSIAWPVLVVGCFLPGVAAWALAFLPLHKWLSDTVMRLVWIGLALVVPLGVGAITRWVTPPEKLHGSLVKTLLGGYVLTVAYFVAFVVTAVSVPVVKVASTAKGWDDVHTYLQPKEGRYFQVVEELARACAIAKVDVRREPVPTHLALATRIIQRFARPFVEPIVAAEPQRLRGATLEAYLYPADLLLRGKAHDVAHVRAAITKTMLEQHAYLVPECEAQAAQDEIQALWDVYAKHESPEEIGGAARSRLREVARDVDEAPISFEAWSTLQMSIRRLERALAGGPSILDAQAAPDMRAAVAVQRRFETPATTRELARAAMAEARELARLEVALARDDVKREVRAAVRGAAFVGAALVALVLGLAACAAALVAALAGELVVPVVIAAALTAVALVAAVMGARAVPREVLGRTRARLAHDVTDVRAHVRA
jgi:hypothetical protein